MLIIKGFGIYFLLLYVEQGILFSGIDKKRDLIFYFGNFCGLPLDFTMFFVDTVPEIKPFLSKDALLDCIFIGGIGFKRIV